LVEVVEVAELLLLLLLQLVLLLVVLPRRKKRRRKRRKKMRRLIWEVLVVSSVAVMTIGNKALVTRHASIYTLITH